MIKIVLLALCVISTPLMAATPVVTNDPTPNADMPFEAKKDLACRIYAGRLHDGSSLSGTTGGVRMSNGGYNYYYYLQDLLDFCLANFNNQGT